MPASYPTSSKAFTTKTNGPAQTIDASHVNDLQLEVTAMETDLIAGLPAARGGTGLTAIGAVGTALTSNGTVASWAVVGGYNAEGRLTLTSATPVTTADVTAATTLYYALYGGNRIALYSGTDWATVAFVELSIAVPATTSQLYDVFIYSNAGTATLELTAWTNDTTRATALTTQNGVLVKTGATTRRYVGSFRTAAVSGQTEDSATKRYVWNYYNRVRRVLARLETAGSWTYTVATVRQANASAANQVDIVIGVQESVLSLTLNVSVSNATAATALAAGIGQDSTTTFLGNQVGYATASGPATSYQFITPSVWLYPAVGRHVYSWNEWSVAAGVTTWFAKNTFGGLYGDSGLIGFVEA